MKSVRHAHTHTFTHGNGDGRRAERVADNPVQRTKLPVRMRYGFGKLY